MTRSEMTEQRSTYEKETDQKFASAGVDSTCLGHSICGTEHGRRCDRALQL